MAKAILGGIAAADKSPFSTFAVSTGQQAPKLPGLVDHSLLSTAVQAVILGLIKDQTCIALSDLMATLLKAPAPEGATETVAEATVLPSEDRLIDPDTQLTPASDIVVRDAERVEEQPISSQKTAAPQKLAITPIDVDELQPLTLLAALMIAAPCARSRCCSAPASISAIGRKPLMSAWAKRLVCGPAQTKN